MARIILAAFVSLDGVMEAPEEWHFPFIDDEVGKHMFDEIFKVEALLLGRVTYDIYAATWPGRDNGENPVAAHFNRIPKYVVSTTLTAATWNNAHLIRDNVVDQVRTLRQSPGANVVIQGSATLANALIKENLVDEYHLLVHPVVVGRGKRLFAEGTNLPAMTLVTAKTLSTGVIDLTYVPAIGEATVAA